MDNHPDGLNDLERQLAELTPAADGLSAEAMLFAAGRDSVRPAKGGSFWFVAAALLALLSGALGAALLNLQAEHSHLVRQWNQAMRRPVTPHPAPTLAPSPPPEPESADRPAADSLLASHRVIECGLDSPAVTAGVEPPGPAPRDAPVLRVRPPEGWPEL